MNIKKIKEAQKIFLDQYPGGFNHPDMVEIGKKHKMDKLIEFATTAFTKSSFTNTELSIENLIKMVTRSSMVSVFEKPKFRDFARALSVDDQKKLVTGIKSMLHGSHQKGFEEVLDVLVQGKLAKWPLISVVPAYFRPNEDIFMKPTTVKGIIKVFELKNLEYKPRPSWEFYEEYRKQLNKMKTHVSKSLSPNNAAFSGFLMMSMEKLN